MLTWLLVVLALAGTILNVRQDRRGFILWGISNTGLAMTNAVNNEWAQATLWMVYVLMAVWGFVSWGDNSN